MRRHASRASTTGWASRTCSSRHARVSGTSTPTRRSSERTWAGLRRSATVPGGAWRSTSASRASRWATASAADRGRGPTMAPMIASAAARSTGSPSRPSSTHSTSAADSARAVASTCGWSAAQRRQLAPAGRSPPASASSAQRRGAIGRRTTTRRPATPVAGGRRVRSARPARRASGPGRTGRAAAPWARASGSRPWASAHTSAGSAPPPAVQQAVHGGEVEGASDRHVAEHRVDRRRRPPHPARPDRRLDPAHLGDRRPDGHQRRVTATMPWAGVATRATGSPRPAGVTRRSSSPRTYGGLADVLDAVVGDRDQAHAEGDRRVPPGVDDAVQPGRLDVGEELRGAGPHGVVVAGQRVGAVGPDLRHLLGRVPVAGVLGVVVEAEAASPRARSSRPPRRRAAR